MLNSLRELFKTNIYAIITALVLAAAITGYLLVIMPMQKIDEDQRNTAVFRNVQQQLIGYIDDQAQAIGEKGIRQKKVDGKDIFVLTDTTDNTFVYKELKIKSVSITSAAPIALKPGVIMLTRLIRFEHDKTNNTLYDRTEVDLNTFFGQISPLKKFDAFYISKVDNDKKEISKILIAENVNIRDQDSLDKYQRKEGVQEFKKSAKRYYTAQFDIAPDFRMYMAAGFDSVHFDSAVRSISPGLLIFSLVVIILLVLSLSLIKPILSGYKERMSQRDFVSVAFSTGALITVLVTFFMVTGWNVLLRDKNEGDLKMLAEKASYYFTRELSYHQENQGTVTGAITERFARMESGNGKLLSQKDSLQNKVPLNVSISKLKYFDNLEEYFTMDPDGLITSNRNKEFPGIPRVYNDRDYYKMLHDPRYKYQKVLTAVLSRRDHTYQWIFAEKDLKGGLNGIAFRDNLFQLIKVPHGTAFLIVKGNGDILYQNDPGEILRGNLLEGTSNEAELLRLLAGNDTGGFTTEYQGVKYQMYGQKLKNGKEQIADNPIYVIAMRDLRFQESLSLFSFSNTFLITLLYGAFIMLMMMVYSATLYSGRLSIFSKQHLAYLFPNNSRTGEYKLLFTINTVAILLIIVLSFLTRSSIALWCCLITGVNMAFLNFALLNNQHDPVNKLLGKIVWFIVLSAVLSFLAIWFGHFIPALLLTLSTHFYLIARHKKTMICDRNDKDRIALNEGVNRRSYSRFFTIVLLKHFGLLPFLLCTTIYIAELNDISVWYCASTGIDKGDCIVAANGCGCNPDPKKQLTEPDILARNLDIGLLGRPSNTQLQGFNFTNPEMVSYLKTAEALSPLDGEEKCIALLLLLVAMALIYLLTKGLIDYYGNRFFFFSLMQAGYEGYYKWEKQGSQDELLPPHEKYAEVQSPEKPVLFSADKDLWVLHKEEFLLQENLRKYDQEYDDIWGTLPVEHQTVLFDFSRDHFVNYKNRDVLGELIKQQLISFDPVTGRLRVTDEVFRNYILETYRKDPVFIAHFNKESKDGFFTKLRLPLIIVAVSLLVLLMYLNKESFSQLLAFGTAITTTLGMVNNLMKGNKPVG